jgi:hypothetical protein
MSDNLFPADGLKPTVSVQQTVNPKKTLTEEQKKKRYQYVKEWRKRNPDKYRKINAITQKNWAENNPEKIREKSKRQYQNRKLNK